jgi:hypothetical protein
MKSLLVMAAAALAVSAADNTLTKPEKAAGWKLLFDGNSMKGWSDSAGKPMAGDSWTIEDGALKAKSKPTFIEDLYSRGKYADFELAFDWRISPAGNSGVKYRIQDHLYLVGERARGRKFELIVDDFSKNRVTARPSGRGQDYVIGFEYQVIDNKANADALSATTHSAGALYDIAAPAKDATKPVGDWNHSRLIVKGSHVEHWLNGEKVVDASIAPDAVKPLLEKRWGQTPYVLKMLGDQPRKACPISLQNHGDDAWFKNIKLRKL